MSGQKIYPGRGRTYVRVDGKQYNLINKRCEHLFWKKKNPRGVTWTVLCRKLHKKGLTEEAHKRKKRKQVKVVRPIQGVDLESILNKQKQSAEFRKEQREVALKKAKDTLKATKEAKKLRKDALRAAMSRSIPQKVKHVPHAGFNKGGKR